MAVLFTMIFQLANYFQMEALSSNCILTGSHIVSLEL